MKQLVLCLLLITIALLTSGCSGRIEGNYPPLPIRTIPPELPNNWSFENRSCPMVMASDDYQGFFVKWHDPINGPRVPIVRQAANYGIKQAIAEVKDIEDYIARGLVTMRIAMFFTSNGEITFNGTGGLKIIFTDKSTVSDEGIIMFKKNRSDREKLDSRKTRIQINKNWRKYHPPGEPIFILIALPREHLGKEVASITLT